MAPKTVPDPVAPSVPKLAPRYRVLIHNDDVTPMDFVVDVLQGVFRLEFGRARDIMMEAHTGGVAHVVTEPLEQAEFHVDQTRSLARARHYPLTFSIEPER
jgi:ATP-dependent Clp protease adaptor protein ClpS